MQLQSRHEDPTRLVLVVEGDLDISTSEDFKRQSEKEYEKAPMDVLLDATGLNYVDSTGLGALIHLCHLMRKEGHVLTLKGLKPYIRKLFTITQMEEYFRFEGEEA